MKQIGLFIAIFLFASASQIAGSPTDSIAASLEQLRQRATQTKDKWNDGDVAAKIVRSIQTYISNADSNSWANPSPERLKRIEAIGKVIEPYTDVLIDLGTPTLTQQGNPNALSILYYATPTDQLRHRLVTLAEVKNPRGAARDAYSILINLGLDTPKIRDSIVEKLSKYVNEYETPYAAELLYGAREWRIPELLPFYRQLLQREYKSKDQQYSVVRLVAESVIGMGAVAEPVLPLLRKSLEQMKREKVDFRDINVIAESIRSIEQEKRNAPLLAMNGSGPLCPEPTPLAKSSTAASEATTPAPTATPAPTIAPITQSPAPAPTPEPKASPQPKPAKPTNTLPLWIWGIAAIFIATLATLLFRFRRK